jgi:peptidoglycan hydrolase CwlO-like protein
MVKKTTLYNSDNEKLYPRTSAECVGYGDGTVKDALDSTGVGDYPVFSASTVYSAGDVVNYNGKLYKFTVDHSAGAWISTDAKRYSLKENLNDFGTYEANPEFIRAYTDAEGKFLWGIRADGTVEWAKGVPTPIQNALKELADKIKDLGGDRIDEVETSLNEKIEALQDAIDVINASLKTLTDTFSYQDSPEFINVVTDNENKVLFGLTVDGKPYFPKNETYSVESNQEFLAAWLDAAGHVLFGLRQDGSTYVAKADFIDKIAKIEQMLKDSGFDDSEIREQITALQGKVDTLSTNVETVKSEYEEIKPFIDAISGTFSIISNDEYLHAIVDADNRLLFGIRHDGTIYMPKQETYSIISNDEWLAAWLDAEGKVLFGVKADGTFWAAKHNFNVGKNYDEQIEQINSTLATMQGSLTSVQESVKNLQGTVDGHTTAIGGLQDIVSGLQQGNEAMQMLSVIDDPEERLAVTTDKDEKVISYRDKDGVLHEKKGVDTSKYYLNGEEKDFTDRSEIAGEVTKAAENGAVKLENVDGVSNHNTPNLLIASEMQKTFNDGKNSFTPPNEGYEMSNPIECQAGDWFTRTGTATGMVVVTDENDKNGTRLFNADGTTLGNTFQVPTDMTWIRYIRMAADVIGAGDGSVVICKGKQAYAGDDKGDYLTVDKLMIQSNNIPKDIRYLKSEDGKYWELYVNESHSLQIREIDPEIITNLPSDFTKLTYSGDFGGYFNYICSGFKYKFVLKPGGVVKYIFVGNLVSSSYGNFEHVVNKASEERYIFGIENGDINNCAKGIMAGVTICDKDMNVLDTGILMNSYDSSMGYPDIHDEIFINDDHIILYNNRSFSFSIGGQFYSTPMPFIREFKKENGEWKTIGEFRAVDYPQLLTDAFGSFNILPIDSHQNTLEFDKDNNIIVNCRNWDTWFIIKRTENSDGTVTLGSKTFDYEEAIIGRVGGRHNSGYLDSKRVLNDGFTFTDTPASLTEVSDDDWEEWQWFHCHDVKYWGMKQIGDKQYPTYTLFDNNYWTKNELVETQYNTLNKHNNVLINPNGDGASYSSSKEDGTYENYQMSRIIQLSIDWENHKMMDYRIYVVPKYYAQQAGGATMYDEGVILVNYSSKARLFDFTQEETDIQGHVYKGAKELYSLDNSSYRTNTY